VGSSIDVRAEVVPAVAVPNHGARLGRRRFVDRLARWVVTAGGLAIIASIAGILLFIVAEVWPLLRPASVTVQSRVASASVAGSAKESAVVIDEYRSHVAGVSADVLRVYELAGGTVIAERDLRPLLGSSGPIATGRTADGAGLYAIAGGRIAVTRIAFPSTWVDGKRTVSPSLGETVVLVVGSAIRAADVRLDEEGGVSVAAALERGGIVLLAREVSTNEMTGETKATDTRRVIATPAAVDHVLLDAPKKTLVASFGAAILWWADASSGAEPERVQAPAKVTALAFLLGERSLLVGDERGTVSLWFPVRQEENRFELTRIREFPGVSEVTAMSSSPRDKSFLAVEKQGRVVLHHATSERTLWTGHPGSGLASIAWSPKADGAVLASSEGMLSLAIRNPHPDVSVKALFGKVWYEGYDQPEYVWQSTGGTDDFETKFSLVPLLFGTVKGTFYSLLLAIPLAVFGAMYTSQFMHPRLRSYVKPAVELMAALPSVVLGFLAGLWLAPRLEEGFPALLLSVLLVPVFVVASGFLWTSVPRQQRKRFPVGTEVIVFAAAIIIGAWFSIQIAPSFELLVFRGTFRTWVTNVLGLGFDQRNALVVGLAMGFAVIPIIFAISEDAFTNVPANLTSASLALGANRWQTVSRVVLPAASPGIFSAIMVGFGRAVGETMIVLMATGNTPIMQWNPFNGFRTLSANIAVEIPEAPYGGTLYRTLFLAALLLFAMTFSVNTIAELVRQRLRQKYSEA